MTGMERWAGKVALVTGASAGIGAAIAEELVKNGMKVVGLARRVERVEELKQKLQGEKGELFPLKGDVSKAEEVEAAFKWIQDKFGAIHVLVNNAGLGRNGLLSTGKMELFQEVVNVNLIGLTHCSQQALKLMKAAGVNDGHIININSIAGHSVPNFPVPIFNVYPATKYAVTALTETLRQELVYLKSKIKVTSLSPGGVVTEFGQASAEGSEGSEPVAGIEELQKLFIGAPMLQPKDIADGAIYVLQTPPHVQVHELTIKPVGEPY